MNFFVLPDFFAAGLTALGEEETPLRRFLVDSLCRGNRGPSYLHFRVSGVKPIQNLVENLLWTLTEDTPHRYNTSQMTMTLLFLQLMSHTETLVSDTAEEAILVSVLRYIETEYRSGSLKEAAARFHYDLPWLSRQIKCKTGKTYTMLDGWRKRPFSCAPQTAPYRTYPLRWGTKTSATSTVCSPPSTGAPRRNTGMQQQCH